MMYKNNGYYNQITINIQEEVFLRNGGHFVII